jgi:hypothetical protein
VRGATFRERGGARCSRAVVAAHQCHLSLVGEVGQHPREQCQRVGGLGARSVDARSYGLAPGTGCPSGERPNGRESIHQSGFRVRRGRMGASARSANGPWTIRPAAWGGPHTRLPFSTSVQFSLRTLGRDGAHRPAPCRHPVVTSAGRVGEQWPGRGRWLPTAKRGGRCEATRDAPGARVQRTPRERGSRSRCPISSDATPPTYREVAERDMGSLLEKISCSRRVEALLTGASDVVRCGVGTRG